MKQTVIVRRPGGKDVWNNPIPGEEFEYPCRIDEKTEVVVNQLGEEVVSSAEILLWGLVDIRYDDTIEFTNEIGVKVSRKPTRIEVVRWFDGKPRYTVVYV